MNSLKDELKYFFSGKGMPYEKVSIIVVLVVVIILGTLLGNNKIKEASVAVIDLDNSRYSRELVQLMDSSTFINITAVLNTPADPRTLFYQDKNIAVVYLPQNLEKDRYGGLQCHIGTFYDNTNSAQNAEVKKALNEIIATENQKNSTDRSLGLLSLHDRNLFNPSDSNRNGQVLGFLFFFSSMFFVFATLGIIPRLRLNGSLQKILLNGTPIDLLVKLVPYGICLLSALFLGMSLLRITGDMVFSGNIIFFLCLQFFYITALGTMSLLFGWTAANPGVASSRMVLFVPGGFILGGMTGPIAILSPWVQTISHIFPLAWEYHFVRDIILRGAGFFDCAQILGYFLIYITILILVFCRCFYAAKQNLLKSNGIAAISLPTEGIPVKQQ